MNLTAVYMKVPEGYVAFTEELPGTNSQGETLEEARTDMRESVAMMVAAIGSCPTGRSERHLCKGSEFRELLILSAA